MVFPQHEPLRYAVSFSLNDTHGSKSLYEGLRHSISFQLPEGLPENNHTGKKKSIIMRGSSMQIVRFSGLIKGSAKKKGEEENERERERERERE